MKVRPSFFAFVGHIIALDGLTHRHFPNKSIQFTLFRGKIMIDENKVTAAIREFCKNPKWNELFRNAPGGAMERMAISFYFSENNKDFSQEDFDEYRALREEIEKTLDREDLEYLIENIGKDDSVEHYKDLLEELEKKEAEEKGGEDKVGGGIS